MYTLFLVLVQVACSSPSSKMKEIKEEKCYHSTGVVHLYHLVNEKFYNKNKFILKDQTSVAFQKIDQSYLTINELLKKIIIIKTDTSDKNSYLSNGCSISTTPYNMFLKDHIYSEMKFIRNFNSSKKDSLNAELNKILDYYFINNKPYFSEQYLKNNTIDNICCDLIIFQLEILSLVDKEEVKASKKL